MPATCNLNKFVPLLDARLNLRCTSGQAHSFFLKTRHFKSYVSRPRLPMLCQQITKRSCTLANKAFSTDLFSLLICNLLENRQSDTCDVILRRNHRFITTWSHKSMSSIRIYLRHPNANPRLLNLVLQACFEFTTGSIRRLCERKRSIAHLLANPLLCLQKGHVQTPWMTETRARTQLKFKTAKTTTKQSQPKIAWWTLTKKKDRMVKRTNTIQKSEQIACFFTWLLAL